MKTYKDFHGDIPKTEIGKRLREILKIEKKSFKILTGYGSTTGKSTSKQAALSSLSRMKKEGLIIGYIPGEVKHQLLTETSSFYQMKQQFETILKTDSDYGNDGIIFIFVK